MDFYLFDTKTDIPPKHINGVSCNVRSCTHHDGDNYCTLEKISIGPSYATACVETVCASYKRKNL